METQKSRHTVIRQEEEKDHQAVYELVELAFRDSPESDHSEHLLVERLRQSPSFIPGLSLVAVGDGGRVEGHIMLTEVRIIPLSGKPAVSLALAPLSVLPDVQGHGIGSALIREAHRRAADMGYGSVVLLGHKDYYPRFGYRPAHTFGIRFPFDAPDECCMAVELHPGALDGISGTVRYDNAFGL